VRRVKPSPSGTRAAKESMSPKRRFQMFLEPAQVEGLRRVEARTGAAMAEQIRRAIDAWLEKEDQKAAPRRGSTRRKA
jgi:hypothetical protein